MMKAKEVARRSVRVPVAKAIPLAANLGATEYVREPELRINILGGIGTTTLARLIATQAFPRGTKLSERILVWKRSEVIAWVESRREAA